MEDITAAFAACGLTVLDARRSERSIVVWSVDDNGVVHQLRVSVGLCFLSVFGPSAKFDRAWGDTGSTPVKVAHCAAGVVSFLDSEDLIELLADLRPRLAAVSASNPTYSRYPGIAAREMRAVPVRASSEMA